MRSVESPTWKKCAVELHAIRAALLHNKNESATLTRVGVKFSSSREVRGPTRPNNFSERLWSSFFRHRESTMMQEQIQGDESEEICPETSTELILLEQSCQSVETSLTQNEKQETGTLLPIKNEIISCKTESSEATVTDPTDDCFIQTNANIQETNESERTKDPTSKDTGLIMKTVHELLECPVCLNNMVPPIVLCECGHNVCFKCRPLMTRCPLCKGSFLNTRNIALEILARCMGFSCDHENCFGRCGTMKSKSPSLVFNDQKMYTCPLTFYSSCYWQGMYSEIREHYENMHSSKILIEGENASWEIKLLVREYKLIFALNEIFFYKEKLDTTLSSFFIQIFYIGRKENICQFSYNMTIRSDSSHQTYTCTNSVLPIEDLEHNYTYTASHCSVIPYNIVNDISKHGDLKSTLCMRRLAHE